jgi:sulfate transport system permease protein
MAPSQKTHRGILPGFGLSMGFTVFYLSVLILLPLSTLFVKASTLSLRSFWDLLTSPRVMAAFRLSFAAAATAALINALFGLIVAWVLVRYRFPGRKWADALVDMPFALPTAVAGIALTAIYAPTGWLGAPLARWGVAVDFTPLGIVVALTFIGLPFVVRTLQPVLESLDPDMEEAAHTLGASRWQTLRRVVFPPLLPALVTGSALAFARAVGEYGSVVFIAGNMPLKTEIAPLLIMTKLEQYDYAGATALALALLLISFALLLAINALQAWTRRRAGGGA